VDIDQARRKLPQVIHRRRGVIDLRGGTAAQRDRAFDNPPAAGQGYRGADGGTVGPGGDDLPAAPGAEHER
jgi:hypothetical protein